jgi:excisionase family DNA binding protein
MGRPGNPIFDVLCEAAPVSRRHLIKLLDCGEMSHHRVGAHRRIGVDDVLASR